MSSVCDTDCHCKYIDHSTVVDDCRCHSDPFQFSPLVVNHVRRTAARASYNDNEGSSFVLPHHFPQSMNRRQLKASILLLYHHSRKLIHIQHL